MATHRMWVSTRIAMALNVRPSAGALAVPYWSLQILFLIAPAVWLRRAIRQRKELRQASGLCSVCGYDLRATPDRCPECGAIPERAKGAAA